MFKHTALLALVASAVVGAATLVSTGADASPHGGRGGASHHRVIGGGHGMVRPNIVRPGIVRHPGVISHVHGHGRHLHLRRQVHLHFRHHSRGHHHHACVWRHGHHLHWHCHRHHAHMHWRTSWVGANYVRAGYPAARPVASTCTCLVKEYLPNGAVLFRDVCTNESAINPPAQAAEVPPQGS